MNRRADAHVDVQPITQEPPMQNGHDTVNSQDQISSLVLLGLAVAGSVVTVGSYLLLGG